MKTPTQARGQRRVTLLMNAAATEIERAGVGALTMNGVAVAAATSPGSLYQFFPSKEALLSALAERFPNELKEIAHVAAASLHDIPPDDIDAIVRLFVSRFAAFYRANPAYGELYNALNRPGNPVAHERALDSAIISLLADALKSSLGQTGQERLSLIATLMLETAHGLLSSAIHLDEKSSAKVEAEFCRMIIAYLSSLSQSTPSA